MTTHTYHRQPIGKGDAAYLATLCAWLAEQPDEAAAELLAEINDGRDGKELELERLVWTRLGNWIGVFASEHYRDKKLRRVYDLRCVVDAALASEPVRTVEVSRPAETAAVEAVVSVQGSLF